MSAVAKELSDYLANQDAKSLLRFLTCGSVDDGKSTLIGRLLYQAQALYEDQLSGLAEESRKVGTRGEDLDYALLLDGLSAEREQGITIDVAYRFFSTERRKFIVADTPGHEQYTRNMVTGASTADLAVILIDARKGLLTQTRRHSYIVSLLGIRNVVLAVNKMDLVDYAEETFQSIEADYRAFAEPLGLTHIHAIPLSAVNGDNVAEHSANTPWYTGEPLLPYLETVSPDRGAVNEAAFRFPVQWVNRPSLDFRGFAGTVVAGAVAPGDRIRVQPSGQESTVQRIVSYDGDLDRVVTGQAVTLTLADEIDISRGDVISAATAPSEVADQFEATLVWMGEKPMLPGRSYRLKLGASEAMATIKPLKHRIDVNTLQKSPARRLEMNDIGVVNLELDRRIAFEPYQANRDMGGFILIDRITNGTVGAGMLHFALRRSQNIHWQAMDIDKSAHATLKDQRPCALWFTGLSGSGKSTIANALQRRLHQRGHHTYLLDGDNVRHGLNKDLGFTDADRVENIRRVAEVSKLMVDAGLITLVSFISPFRSEREMAKSLFADGEFLEVYVDTPLAVAEERDVKGLYAKARRGELKNFTGIDSPYEAPEHPNMRIDTVELSADDAAEQLLADLEARGMLTVGD
ncbi:MAG: sulfate adenylyltransferase subunit CysN [Pseudomonadota bacterium]